MMMRGLKSTIVLLVVLAGLVGYIYFVDASRPAGDDDDRPKAFDVSADNIEEVEIKGTAGETARVQRIDTGWQLLEPEKAEADADTMASVTSSLASLQVQRVVDENPTDLAQYGLNPPRLDVAFRLKDQKEFQRLLVGEKTPTGGDLYAKKPGESRVFLISSYLESTFNKTAFDVRDKDVLKFDRDKAEGLEVETGTTTIQLARKDTDWRLVKPVAARADYGASEGLLTQLSSAQMQKIAASDAKDLRAYGLDRPSVTVSVTSGSSRATLLLGKSGDGGLFAKDASRPMVFTVAESLAGDVGKDVFHFRRKDMFDARSFTANRVEVRRDDATVAFEETKGTDGKDVWRNAAGQDADTAKVEDLISKLTNLRAQSFEPAEHASLKSPALTATIRFDDNKTETVTFGRAGADVFAKRADEPGTARIDAMLFDDVIKALDGLK